MKHGYSLIELVITVGLTSILVITITSIAMTSLIGSTRIRNLVKTRQSGDSAITQIQSKIRNAKEISSCDSAANTITLVNPDNETTTYDLEVNNEVGMIASNAGVYITGQESTVTSFDIECLPSDTEPSLVNVKFSITSTNTGSRSHETPIIPFATSVYLRNE